MLILSLQICTVIPQILLLIVNNFLEHPLINLIICYHRRRLESLTVLSIKKESQKIRFLIGGRQIFAGIKQREKFPICWTRVGG
jgi:hypothetical protein